MKSEKWPSIAILVVLLLFIALFVFFMYTFLHEAGHAITGLLFGQSLTEFDVSFWNFSAHVGMVGGKLTRSQLAVQAAAGASLPLLLWAIFISLVPRKANFLVETLKILFSMAVINTLLVWIILPILYLLGEAPSDDVTNFLRYSEMPPLLLTALAVILYVVAWILFLSKIDGLRNELLLFSTTNRSRLTSGVRTTMPAMAGVMALCVVVAFTLNGFAQKNSVDRFLPPQDFAPVAEVELSKQDYSSEILAQFTLDRPVFVGVFIAIHNIDTTYFDLSVIGPEGFHATVLHGEGYKAYQDGGLWEENLPAGTYQLVLTSHQSPGIASVYLKLNVFED